jgi:hypothetical protein
MHYQKPKASRPDAAMTIDQPVMLEFPMRYCHP